MKYKVLGTILFLFTLSFVLVARADGGYNFSAYRDGDGEVYDSHSQSSEGMANIIAKTLCFQGSKRPKTCTKILSSATYMIAISKPTRDGYFVNEDPIGFGLSSKSISDSIYKALDMCTMMKNGCTNPLRIYKIIDQYNRVVYDYSDQKTHKVLSKPRVTSY
jgi:hypothetical protein